MEAKPTIKGFLKGFLGLNSTPANPQNPNSSNQSPTQEPPQPIHPLKEPKPRSEAYLNRRKGRIKHGSTLGYIETIAPYLLDKGEVSPGDMARELGIPKSTLIYNLNRLSKICNGAIIEGRDLKVHVVNNLLKGHRLERVGGGKYTRYRLVPSESKD